MSIPRYDVEVIRGDTGTVDHWTGLEFQLKQDDGTPWDVTGASFIFTAEWPEAQSLTFTSAASEISVDATDAIVTVPFAGDTFDAVPDHVAVRYFLRMETASFTRTLFSGQLKVRGPDD